ncbi:MAG: hypothetical protein WB420_08900, partial [Bradyrhizobium sp.]
IRRWLHRDSGCVRRMAGDKAVRRLAFEVRRDGIFFMIVLGSMGASTDPIKLNKPAQPSAVATVQKEKQ